MFIIPIWVFLLVNILKRNSKIYTLLFYSVPLLFSYFVFRLVNPFYGTLRYVQSEDSAPVQALGSELWYGFVFTSPISYILTSSFGMLFAPGVGLFIFAPILLTVFFSFPDFFRKNKSECILLLSFFVLSVVYHTNTHAWHGLVAWGSRYLVILIPFLLIPLGASLENKETKNSCYY
tara:strand:- start:143 stop:673 length:531 start_codon:yes stop_codon:yes gene_type:complete